MMQKVVSSPADYLRERGFLTINGFVEYLKQYYPVHSVSYPTAKRYCEKGILRTIEIGGQTRIPAIEVCKYVNFGTNIPNCEEGEGGLISSLSPIEGYNPADQNNLPMQEW